MSQQYPYVESQGLYFPKHILEKWTLQKGGKREPTLAFWEKWAHSRFLCGGQRGHEPRGASPPIGRINSSQPTGLPVLCGLARLKNISSVNQILCRELEIGNTERTAKLAMGTEAETSWYSEGPEKLRWSPTSWKFKWTKAGNQKRKFICRGKRKECLEMSGPSGL